MTAADIQPVGDGSDRAAFVAIVNAVTPDDPAALDQLDWEDATYPGSVRFLARLGDRVVGASSTGRRGEVVVRTRLGDSGQRSRLTVQDSGPGFAENILKRAFEPYVTTKTKGTGLGLAIVKKIMEDHGGRLSLDDRTEGPGAVATLSLPLLAMAAVEA